MGPITLFDKSFLQSLTLDESVWFDHFFYSNICPLFYVETLADLSKTSLRSGRTAEDEVKIIADKTPELHGAPCTHHAQLCISNLMGTRVPMRGQIPIASGRPVRSEEGHEGIVYGSTPEARAFARWQERKFAEVERHFAREWREMLSKLDLPSIAQRMRAAGIDAQSCKTLADAHAIASRLVRSRDKPYDQMAMLFAFVEIPNELREPILRRWSVDRNRPLHEYAPYAAHVLTVELFFQIALAAHLISAERPSNRVDVAYLHYLPFCSVFVSSDRLHRSCALHFLREDQQFVWGQDLKADLAKQNAHFSALPERERERGLMKFAVSPVGSNDDLTVSLWDRFMPKWRTPSESIPLDAEAERKLVESLNKFSDAPTFNAEPDDKAFTEPDRVAIQRFVHKKKGNWWLLPKDLDVTRGERTIIGSREASRPPQEPQA